MFKVDNFGRLLAISTTSDKSSNRLNDISKSLVIGMISSNTFLSGFP